MSRNSGIGWFWVGTGLGLLFSTTAVIVASEFYHLQLNRKQEKDDYEQGEADVVEDLSHAVHGGLQVLSRAATEITHSFDDARREVIRYGLDPTRAGAGSHAWYAGEEDE